MKRVLIADDYPENLYFLEVLLKGNGFEVISAENGAEALELARSNPPDLIISDILMPVMDGYAFCSKLKADEKLKLIPFIFYTATFTEAKDETLALSLGADRFVVKPQEPDALMEVVNQVLSLPRPALAPPQGAEIITEYSESLFRKLEKKMTDLEQANQELQLKNQELLQARFAAECANQTKLRFLHIVSHELRTPLNIILGALQLSELDHGFDAALTKTAKDALFSMLEMIDNILETSSIERAEQIFSQEPVSLQYLLVTLENLFSTAAHDKGIQLRMSLDDNLPQQIVTDGTHLQQILAHLLSNALKFTKKGVIELRVKLKAGAESERALIQFEVQDTGIGVDPDKQRMIFDLFVQADDSYTRPYGGIGLGLYLTKRVVELLGGSIDLKSAPDAGSIFTVGLPLNLSR